MTRRNLPAGVVVNLPRYAPGGIRPPGDALRLIPRPPDMRLLLASRRANSCSVTATWMRILLNPALRTLRLPGAPVRQ